MLKACSGIIEGVALSQFLPGASYDVSETLGLQLLDMQAAVEVRATDPLSDHIDLARLTDGVHVALPDKPAERPE